MVFKKDENDTGNWNFNKGFLQIINEIFAKMTYYKELAELTSEDMIEEMTMNKFNRAMVRLNALKRYNYYLKELHTKTEAFVRGNDNIEKMKEIRGRLELLYRNHELCSKNVADENGSKITLNMPVFNLHLEELDKLENEIMTPLNKSALIFEFKEPFDKKKFKEESLKEFEEEG